MATKKTFSQKMEQLEKIHNALKESSSHSLEEFVSLYKEGIHIAKELEHELNALELEVQHIEQDGTHTKDIAPSSQPDAQEPDAQETVATRNDSEDRPDVSLFDSDA